MESSSRHQTQVIIIYFIYLYNFSLLTGYREQRHSAVPVAQRPRHKQTARVQHAVVHPGHL